MEVQAAPVPEKQSEASHAQPALDKWGNKNPDAGATRVVIVGIRLSVWDWMVIYFRLAVAVFIIWALYEFATIVGLAQSARFLPNQ